MCLTGMHPRMHLQASQRRRNVAAFVIALHGLDEENKELWEFYTRKEEYEACYQVSNT